MSSITTIQSTDLITNSRAVINTNFSNLNTDKMETSVLDTDTTLAANSDLKVATQKAVKAYVDSGGNSNASTTQKGIVEEATAAEIAAGTATGGTGARLFVNPSTFPHTDVQVFTSTGANTWTKPTGAKFVQVVLIGGGGKGGNGVVSNTNSSGGAGGGGAARNMALFPASILGSTETVTVATGSQDTTFGAWLIATRGSDGADGVLSASTTGGNGGAGTGKGSLGVAASDGLDTIAGGASGGAGVVIAAGKNGGAGYINGGAGGGAGGGLGANAGGNGGTANARGTGISGGIGGVGGAVGGTPSNVTASEPMGGAGAGGGAGNTAGVAGNGGVGGKYGGGGGGGGSTAAGGTGGTGGAGGAGMAVVTTFF